MKRREARYTRRDHLVEWTTCETTGKRRYASRKAARKAAAQARGKGHDHGVVDAFLCNSCAGYHLGHLPKVVRDGDMLRWDLQS